MEEKTKYFILQTEHEIRLVTTSDVSNGWLIAKMKGFRVQNGVLHTWKDEEKRSGGFLDRLVKHGYEAITESQYQEHLKTAADIVLKQGQEPKGEKYSIVPWETIEKQYSPDFQNDVVEYLGEPEYRKFCLYAGDTVIDGDLIIDYSELGSTPQTATRNIVVNGNLTIKGNFDGGNDIESLPQFVYVKGDLYAENLILSGWLDIIVEGNVIVNNTILAYYGEPGGRLLVNGDLKTEYLLNGWMYLIEVKGNTTGLCYSFDLMYGVEGFEVLELKEDLKEEEEWNKSPLSPVLSPYNQDTKEYSFRFDLACAQLRKGLSIFKP